MKFESRIFSILITSMAVISFSHAFISSGSTKCNTGFMKAFGLKGRTHAKFGSVEMCSGVKNSCCTQEDQMVMYGAWISGKTQDKITHRYKTLNLVYDSLISQLKIVHDFAKKVEDLLVLKKYSNCKFLANRITSYRLPTVEASLKQSFDDMGQFFTSAYKGIYCTMCNADNHVFIQEKKTILVLNEDTCRVMTEKTLAPMLYLHVHLSKYINLVTKFMSSCDFRGDYELDIVIPKDHIFTVDEAVKTSLNECKLYRNTKQWLVYCKDVCEKFTIGKFDAFFEPNRIKVAKYVIYLKSLVSDYIRKEKSMPLFNTNIDSGSSGSGDQGNSSDNNNKQNSRVLASGTDSSSNATTANNNGSTSNNNNQNGDNQNNNDPNNPANNDQGKNKDKMYELITAMESEKDVTTFKFDTSAPISAGNFKSAYKRYGIDLVNAGEASIFEEAIFNQVKTIVNLQRLASTSAGELTPQQKEMLAASSASKMTAFIVGLLSLMMGLLW